MKSKKNTSPVRSRDKVLQSLYEIELGGSTAEEILEDKIGIKAIREFTEMQPGDVETTYADCSKVNDWIDFKPQTSLIKGIEIFIDWYKDYYFEKKNLIFD